LVVDRQHLLGSEKLVLLQKNCDVSFDVVAADELAFADCD